MSPEEMRAQAERCDRVADSLDPPQAELRERMRRTATEWREIAAEMERREPEAVVFEDLRGNWHVCPHVAGATNTVFAAGPRAKAQALRYAAERYGDRIALDPERHAPI